MNFAFIAAVAVSTIEGVLGKFLYVQFPKCLRPGGVLNAWLLYSLVRSKRSLMEGIYRVPIFVSSVQNLVLCLLVATMNFVHIFRDGTFVSCMFGPLTHILPKLVTVMSFQIAMVLTTVMWTLIPVTGTLQLLGLSRCAWSVWKRLFVSFTFTMLCSLDVALFTPQFVPTAEFNLILEEIVRDLYGLDRNFTVVAVGSTAKYVEMNNGRSLITLLLYLVLAPYILSYGFFLSLVCLIRRRLTITGVTLSERTLRLQRAFHIMQLLQGFLPLAIISVPALVFVIGALLQSNLDFITLIFTFFLWICPSVQAGVQLRFVRQSISRSPDSTRAGGVSTRRASDREAESRRGSER